MLPPAFAGSTSFLSDGILGLAPQALCCHPLHGLNVLLGDGWDPGARAPGFMLPPAPRAQCPFWVMGSWGSRPRVYAAARFRGLNVLFGRWDPGARAPGFMLPPALRAQCPFWVMGSWGSRPRLYAVARFRGLCTMSLRRLVVVRGRAYSPTWFNPKLSNSGYEKINSSSEVLSVRVRDAVHGRRR
jgi:hypothetical protein